MTSVTVATRAEFNPTNAAGPANAAHPTEGAVGACPYFNAMKAGDAGALRDVARQTLRDKVFGDESCVKAEKVLIGALQMDPQDAQGKTNHLLGLTYFQAERWGDAIKHLTVAVARDPANADAVKLLAHAKLNAGTGVERHAGTTAPLDGRDLLKPPALFLREPQDLKPVEPGRRGNALQVLLGNVTGKVTGAITDSAAWIAGIVRNKHTTFAFEDWDNRSRAPGELMLAAFRTDLDGDKLQSTYPKGTPVAGQAKGQVRPAWTERYRTATGAWNTNDPMEGAAGTQFQRTGAPLAARKNRALDPSLPNPREVSRALLYAKGPRQEVPFLNSLSLAWIQFQTHDWVSHRPGTADGAYKIPLAPDDPLKKTYGMDALFVPKTSADPLGEPGKITHANEVTHWWDGSQIYGSDQATQDQLRAGPDGKALADGKLRIAGDLLPVNPQTGVEDTGFARNWWVGLDVFHTVFVKEHNHICDVLKAAHPTWSTDQIFNTARLINAAELAKIHTVEWTPAVLPNKKLVRGMGANWWGMLETVTRPFEERMAVRPGQPKHPIIGGLVGGKTDNHGKPYGLSEEFVEVYRLHAGMMDRLDIRKVGDAAVSKSIPAETTRGTGARGVMEDVGLADLANSMGYQHMNALVHNNYPDFMGAMSVPGQPVIDIGAVDILRARERGVPQYNQFRRDLGLNPIQSFSDLGCSKETVAELERLYGKGGVEKLDLLAGTLCELKRPKNYGFGETMFTVFIQMASRRLEADPFFTEKFDEAHYSKEGLALIEKCTMKDILLRHCPSLAQSGLAGVNNAFEPWGTTAATHPEEHPLTAESEQYARK